jgi:hypothetical protein
MIYCSIFSHRVQPPLCVLIIAIVHIYASLVLKIPTSHTHQLHLRCHLCYKQSACLLPVPSFNSLIDNRPGQKRLHTLAMNVKDRDKTD